MENIIILGTYLILLIIITYVCRSNRRLKRDKQKLNEIIKLPKHLLQLKDDIDKLSQQARRARE